MNQKVNYKDLLRHLDSLKKNTEGIWGQAVLGKDKIVSAHHRLKTDPRLYPQMFTKGERYQHGRALIAFKDQKAVLSREEADIAFYQKLMSNKFKDGSLSDRKKPHLFLTRDSLASGNVKRVVAKFCRDFGSQPHGIAATRSSFKPKLAAIDRAERKTATDNHWRHSVNEFVLGRYGEICSPSRAKHAEATMLTLLSVRSAPVSPSPICTSRRRVVFSTVAESVGARAAGRRDTEALDLKQEIKQAKRQFVDERLKLSIGKLKCIDSVKVPTISKAR